MSVDTAKGEIQNDELRIANSELAILNSKLLQMTAEHSGMAEELLSLYEQLGVVFEVSRSLGSVKNERDVLDLFIGSLRHSFAGRMVDVTRSNGTGDIDQLSAISHQLTADDWIPDLIRRSVQQGQVLVEARPEENVETSKRQNVQPCNSSLLVVEAMAGPVIAGDSLVCVLVLTRRTEGDRPACLQAFRASDMQLLESLSMFCGDLIRNHRLVHELRTMSVAVVRALVSAVDQKDTYTSGHSIRVAYFATMLGREAGLSEEDMQMLQWSALLHDVGKIGIRDDVLKKPGKLTKEEFDHIKEHPVRSFHVVEGIPHLSGALDGVLYHHERIDGTGYPEGLVGEEIPLQARIIQIADIFDALTSDRSYRGAYEWPEALEILHQCSGTTSDASLLPVFDRIIREAIGLDPDGWAKLIEQAEQFILEDTMAYSDPGEA